MLNVDLKVLKSGCLLVCQGELIGGKEADYLYRLITRDDRGDVILDLTGVRKIDDEGLAVIVLGYEVLAGQKRKLFLRSPSTDLLVALRKRQMEAPLEPPRRTEPSRTLQ